MFRSKRKCVENPDGASRTNKADSHAPILPHPFLRDGLCYSTSTSRDRCITRGHNRALQNTSYNSVIASRDPVKKCYRPSKKTHHSSAHTHVSQRSRSRTTKDASAKQCSAYLQSKSFPASHQYHCLPRPPALETKPPHPSGPSGESRPTTSAPSPFPPSPAQTTRGPCLNFSRTFPDRRPVPLLLLRVLPAVVVGLIAAPVVLASPLYRRRCREVGRFFLLLTTGRRVSRVAEAFRLFQTTSPPPPTTTTTEGRRGRPSSLETYFPRTSRRTRGTARSSFSFVCFSFPTIPRDF